MKKSELRQMIREMLKEELEAVRTHKRSINELLVGENEGDYSSYKATIEGSNKRLIGKGEKDGLALRKIIEFIKNLSQDEKDNLRLSWNWDEDFADGEGDVIVSVYGPSEIGEGDSRTMSNWRYAENAILVALGLKI